MKVKVIAFYKTENGTTFNIFVSEDCKSYSISYKTDIIVRGKCVTKDEKNNEVDKLTIFFKEYECISYDLNEVIEFSVDGEKFIKDGVVQFLHGE